MESSRPGSSVAENLPRYDTPPAPPPPKRPAHVTSGAPAKRVTFFKSGDSRFAGVKMAIHQRGFKSFDALLDDLSRKVPLPFGVRTITTPRGTHRINALEQLQDGGCYLCSDRRAAKPADPAAAERGPGVRRPSRPRRKPSRPEEAPARPRYSRHLKRVVLVKNTDPAVRHSVIVSRYSTRSLRAFMEEVSELMGSHIRSLYALDGRKIDSVQSLMQCPSVLVCVGQEPFRPLLVDSSRRSSKEKLPGLRNRTCSSVISEGQDSKKNVNFGLETKKSVIHPRSDSSNRSARFSLSSEKSYPNGLNTSPGHSGSTGPCPSTKGTLGNEDIEKRVVVNKDGSLSVQMRVRFRLLNDETLQWSTEIKKSAFGSDCRTGKGQESYDPQQEKSQSCSEPEYISCCEAEDTYTANPSESHCQICCNHCQEYDIWKHPVHGNPPSNQPAPSAGSSTSYHKVFREKESVENVQTMSTSSEEYREYVVEKATCFQQTVQGGDTRLEYCSISRCCSQSSTCSISAGPNAETDQETHRSTKCDHHSRPNSCSSVSSLKEQQGVKVDGVTVTEERPASAISNSSKVLAALKEDQDADDDAENDQDEDLTLSASRASALPFAADEKKMQFAGCAVEDPDKTESVRSIKLNCSTCSASPLICLTPTPPGKGSSSSGHSVKLRKSHKAEIPEPNSLPVELELVDSDEKRITGDSSCRLTPECNSHVVSEDEETQRDHKRAHSSGASRESKASEHSFCMRALPAGKEGSDHPATGRGKGSSISNTPMDSPASGKSRDACECLNCDSANRIAVKKMVEATAQNGVEMMVGEGDPRSVTSASVRTNTSARSVKSSKSEHTKRTETPASEISGNLSSGDEGEGEREPADKAASVVSNKSRASAQSGGSHRSVCSACSHSEAKDKVTSAKSRKTATPAGSAPDNNGSMDGLSESAVINKKVPEETARSEDRDVTSALSHQSHISEQSRSSRPSELSKTEPAVTLKSKGDIGDNSERVDDTLRGKRPDSSTSARSNVSAISKRSNCSQGDVSGRSLTPACANPPAETVERAASSMSNCTLSSLRSNASTKLAKSDYTNCQGTERTPSVTSMRSNSSEVSKKSNRLESLATAMANLNGEIEFLSSGRRTASALSLGSKASVKSGSSSKLIHNAQEETSVGFSAPATPMPEQEGDNRAGSTLSVQTKASGMSQKSTKCHCVAFEKDETTECVEADAEMVASVVSRKSAKSQASDSERIASPTSTVSISIGVAEEQASNDAEDRVKSSTSDKSLASACSFGSKGKSERLTPKAPVIPIVDQTEDSSKHVGSPTSISSGLASGSETDGMSCKSTSTKHSKKGKSEHYLHAYNDRTSSVTSKASNKKPSSKHSEPGSKTSGAAQNAGTLPREVENGVDTVSDKDFSSVDSRSSRSNDIGKDTTPRPISKASSRSATSKSTIKNHCIAPTDKRPKSSQSKTSSHLQVNGNLSRPHSVNGSVRSVKTKSSNKVPINDLKVEEGSRSNSANSQNCLSPSPPNQRSHRHNGPAKILGNSGDSILSNSLSAADLVRKNSDSRLVMGRPKCSTSDIVNNGAPDGTDCGKHGNDVKSEKSDKSSARKGSRFSQVKVEEGISELVPSSLPDASPMEVINEWLRKIPSDELIYQVGDDFEEFPEAKKVVEVPKLPDELSYDVTEGDQSCQGGKQLQEKVQTSEEVKKETCTEGVAELEPPDTTDIPPVSESKLCIRDVFPENRHSSVQVMKVLLNSKLDRCNSLPEVSPVYGRKLSSSAKDLMDCLKQLQLVGSDPMDTMAESGKYQEVIDILQSLWISDPLDCHLMCQKSQPKEHSPDDEGNLRSSSGVDVGGSSGESGKSMGTVDLAQKVEVVHGRITPVLEQDVQEEVTEVNGGEEDSQHTTEDASDPATPDIARRVQGTPGVAEAKKDKEEELGQDEEVGLASEQTLRSNESSKKGLETPSSNKSLRNDSNPEKSPEETDSSSGTPPSIPKALVTEKGTQDPDPAWVLHLLQKLEKQFMTHYVTAMAEFKVRWDLDDSVMLNTMIDELKEEVHKRIQSSISQELKKIHSRAGRAPRPPLEAISRDSTQQTEQRRKRLWVMRNKSIYSSLCRSEENLTGSATDYSDQRSEDEFCPCDTCMKKKMATRSIPPESLNIPPMMKDFDLRKILQKKQEPPQMVHTEQQGALAENEEKNVVADIEKEQNEDEAQEHQIEGRTGETVGENKEVEKQEDETTGDEGGKISEDKVEEGGVEEEVDGSEGIVAAEEEIEDKKRETDTGDIAGCKDEGSGDEEAAEDSKEDEEAGEEADEGCVPGDSKDEGGVESEQNREEPGEEELNDDSEELGKQADVEPGRGGVGETEVRGEVVTGGENGVEDSGAEDPDVQGREEREEEVLGHEETRQRTQEDDAKERCGEEDNAVEEVNGVQDVCSRDEEEKDSKGHMVRQLTKSSMESQQGSVDNCTDP